MLSIIAAVANNMVIGINNDLPWQIKEDLQYFKNKTVNKKVVMGRKTFESLDKPLPNRTNIVLSRANDFSHKGTVCLTLEEVISYADTDEEVFIIGGSEIYTLLMPYVQRMYITDIFLEVAGDAHFPTYDLADWNVNSIQLGDGIDPFYEFITLHRKS